MRNIKIFSNHVIVQFYFEDYYDGILPDLFYFTVYNIPIFKALISYEYMDWQNW